MKNLSIERLRRRISMANGVSDQNIIEAEITRRPNPQCGDTAIMFRVRRGAVHAVTQLKLSLVDVYQINNCVESKNLDKRLEI